MKKNHHDPPQFFLRFFRWFCHPELRDYIEGDLVELYRERVNVKGKRRADIKIIFDVLLLFRPGIIRPSSNYHLNQIDMFRNYLKIAWRNLLKRKAFSIINISGLTAGMVVAMLIGLWIRDEVSFDRNFKNHDRLAEIMLEQVQKGITYTGRTIAPPLANVLRDKYSEDVQELF